MKVMLVQGTHVELSFEVCLLALEFGLFIQEFGDAALCAFEGDHEVVFLFEEGEVGGLQFLTQFGLTGVVLLSLGGLLLQGADLVLDTGDVEEGLDLLPEAVPGPSAELHELPDVPLDDDEGHTLLLKLLVGLTAGVATNPRLQPRDDLGQTVVTDFLESTKYTGTEEHLYEEQHNNNAVRDCLYGPESLEKQTSI